MSAGFRNRVGKSARQSSRCVGDYRPRLDELEDRTLPAVGLGKLAGLKPAPVLPPARANIPAGDVVAGVLRSFVQDGGPAGPGGNGSLTLDVITNVHPVPPGLPDIPPQLPFPIDPIGDFWVVIYATHRIVASLPDTQGPSQ